MAIHHKILEAKPYISGSITTNENIEYHLYDNRIKHYALINNRLAFDNDYNDLKIRISIQNLLKAKFLQY
jgi:hypothetical protein